MYNALWNRHETVVRTSIPRARWRPAWPWFLAFGARLALAEDDLLPPDQAFKFSARVVDAGNVELHWRIANGYYMYRDKFRFSAQPATVALGKPEFPAGKIKEDEFFGKVETYRDEVVVRIPVKADGPFTLQAQSQGCADVGVCYTPVKQSAQLVLAAADTTQTAPTSDSGGVMSKLRALTGGDGQEDFLPVEKAFQVDVKVRDAQTLVAELKPADTYYLYRDKIAFAVPKESGVSIAKVVLPRGDKKSDPNFGDTEVFHRPVQALITLNRSGARDATRVSVEARYQGCSEKGLCYPPAKKSFDLTLAAWQPATVAGPSPQPGAVPQSAAAVPPPVGSAANDRIDSARGDVAQRTSRTERDVKDRQHSERRQLLVHRRQLLRGGPAVVVHALCVPDDPDPVRDHRRPGSPGHQAPHASAFAHLRPGHGGDLALAGVAAGLSGTLLSNALQNPWVLGAFAALFVVLSLSMFGFYDLQLPSALQSRLSDTSNRMRRAGPSGACSPWAYCRP